ncbi:branched-chain amino acid ABC transporter substrate-binding protein [Jiella sonneratiae]|uniref:Branched-chain amino acid ABC transporter substrate-binding protein n=1 Tax=Jiella sonneratiae TaxID=2816856 RepID=A0ABS3IY68_9HYPH|nr:branched-chain amino acid ABC transporter substrate-binding protein [Jiella sonneratiae]MBO0902361.1 branched-chain amino acid ABC transporter substrate-binding protein [Jiella sonneratiae]
MRAHAILALSLLSAVPASAQEAATPLVGVAAPLADSQAILGRQLTAGVAAAVASHGGGTARTVVADTSCSAEGGAAAAKNFVAEKADVVVGFLCIEAIEAALPILKKAGIPTLDVGVRANRLTDDKPRSGNLLWRIAPRSDAEAIAVSRYVAARWADQPFGLVDDGSIAARSLSDSVRRRLADQGLKPQTLDNFRPAEEKQFGLARRMERSGVTRFFIAGDRPDVAIIARDAKELGLDLSIVGSEALFDEASTDTPLPAGIVAIGPQTRFPELEPKDEAEGTRDETGRLPPQGYFGPAYVATEIAIEAVRRSREDGGDGGGIDKALAGGPFETSLGKVTFDKKGDGSLDLFRVFEWRGDEFADETGG